jgi:hypothetical protein
MSKEKKRPSIKKIIGKDRPLPDMKQAEEIADEASEHKGTDEKSKRGPGRPKKTHDRVRFTTIIEPDLRRKIKAIAALTDNQIHDLVNQAIDNYVSQYEKENGPIE